jgi:RimJ/RimL family protein N-acetyltransferase
VSGARGVPQTARLRIRTPRLLLRSWRATEAAAALTRCALERHAIEKVEIRCDPENRASVRIPERLGFRLRERLAGHAMTHDGRPRDTLVWEFRAGEVTPDWAQAYPVVYEEEEA